MEAGVSTRLSGGPGPVPPDVATLCAQLWPTGTWRRGMNIHNSRAWWVLVTGRTWNYTEYKAVVRVGSGWSETWERATVEASTWDEARVRLDQVIEGSG